MPTEQQSLYRRAEAMLRNLLAEEFKLVSHREMRSFPVYALVIAKGGPKLNPAGSSVSNLKADRGRREYRHESMAGLASSLYWPRAPHQLAADRPVIDKTELEGFYDFTLEWTPATTEGDPAASGQAIYTAMEQQLGLKLQPEKMPIEFLVIDHAEKPTRGQ